MSICWRPARLHSCFSPSWYTVIRRRDDPKAPQVPIQGVRTCPSSPTPWSPSESHRLDSSDVAFGRIKSLGTPDDKFYDAPWLRVHAPLPTLRRPLTGISARLTDSRGSVTPSTQGTYTLCPVPVRLAHSSTYPHGVPPLPLYRRLCYIPSDCLGGSKSDRRFGSLFERRAHGDRSAPTTSPAGARRP